LADPGDRVLGLVLDADSMVFGDRALVLDHHPELSAAGRAAQGRLGLELARLWGLGRAGLAQGVRLAVDQGRRRLDSEGGHAALTPRSCAASGWSRVGGPA